MPIRRKVSSISSIHNAIGSAQFGIDKRRCGLIPTSGNKRENSSGSPPGRQEDRANPLSLGVLKSNVMQYRI